MSRTRIVALAVTVSACLAVAAPVAAQTAPTPEAAGAFIDKVMANGVTTFAMPDSRAAWTAVGMAATASETRGCQTRLSWRETSWVFYWDRYVTAEAKSGGDLHPDYVVALTGTSLEGRIGLLADPGSAEMTQRLLKAISYLGKACTKTGPGAF